MTVLVGAEDQRVDDALATMRAICKARRSFVNPLPWGPEGAHPAGGVPILPLEVLVGGATVFGLPVKRHLRLRGGSAPAVADEHSLASGPRPGVISRFASDAKGVGPMELILAVVHKDDADAVIQALLKPGYRVTRIDTAGGFLRRGNATLLIGVESQKVDDVLAIIQTNCRLRTEANPADAGIPMYGATVFVLETTLTAHL